MQPYGYITETIPAIYAGSYIMRQISEKPVKSRLSGDLPYFFVFRDATNSFEKVGTVLAIYMGVKKNFD